MTSALPTPLDLLENTPWYDLEHAYGEADDTPRYLYRLLHDDPGERSEAFGRIDSSLIHQGYLYSATAPAALYISAILDDSRTGADFVSPYPWDGRRRPLRAALLNWLRAMARSCAYDEDDTEDEDIVACREVRPLVLDAVLPWLDDPQPAVRSAAVDAAAELLRAPGLAHRVSEAAAQLLPVARSCADREERGTAVLQLGTWGEDVSALLADADPAIRACAALAPAQAGDPAATAELLAALTRPRVADDWFPGLHGWFRARLVAAAVERVATFEELLPQALAVLKVACDSTAEDDWGPLLRKAFPDGRRSGDPLTDAQRRFLHALAGHDDYWGASSHETREWLRSFALPADREELAALTS
ncbi:HEAT repeat domain-containing protein [Streptomyces antibioticus]|uniref:HEAT repeat domain-containing protein n=1 Tax=Streptomyces antibioticus TaxID=1890 RepID=UPI00339F4CF6